jgi:hypothetical protein
VLDNDTIESPVSLALSTGVHVYTHARTHAPFLICIYIVYIHGSMIVLSGLSSPNSCRFWWINFWDRDSERASSCRVARALSPKHAAARTRPAARVQFHTAFGFSSSLCSRLTMIQKATCACVLSRDDDDVARPVDN